jgi:iron complex outermembrane receptor protein
MNILRCLLLIVLCVVMAKEAAAEASDLTELSIEELLTIEVTSVAKKRQRVEDAAAAVFVISQEDIRRSGATRITDLLRMVPGVQVGENDTNSVAVSARGFNERFSNKLLVLVDGRAIYRSVLSGVMWDQVLVPLQQIERIEVVRGPGATLWGANAVNGIINIITKHPIDTQGGLVSARVGTNDLAGVYGRWGGLLGEDGAYRFYVRGDIRRGLVDDHGDYLNDPHRSLQSGFRIDWEPNDQDAFTFQGDVQKGFYETVVGTSPASIFSFLPLTDTDEQFFGFNLLTRWARSHTDLGDFSLQGYVDHLTREEFGGQVWSTIVGLDFQHSLVDFGNNEVVWGVNYQMASDRGTGLVTDFDHGSQTNHVFGVFVQDEIEILPNELNFTVGTKLEYNTVTGFEIQPSARLFWRPDENFAIWGAVSRAVRTPARFEADLAVLSDPIPPGVPPNSGPLPLTIGVVGGGSSLDPETLYAFELGTRLSPSDTLSFDVATYYNIYDNLLVVEPLGPIVGPTGVFQGAGYTNGGKAKSYGIEVAADWKVTDRWTLKGAYSFERIDSSSAARDRFEGMTPKHQVSLRSQYNVTPEIEFDLWLRAQDRLTESGTPGFVDLDARLGWHPRPDLEFSIVGRNLLHAHRTDFRQSNYPTAHGQVERSVFASVEFHF